jgi:glycosyltransferase involved in cell wall biosynthesis
MKYFVVVQASAYSLSAGSFALESAFAVHLRKLRQLIGPKYEELVLIGPGLSEDAYRASAAQMETVDAAECGVRFMPAFPASESRRGFLLRRLVPTWRWLKVQFSAPCVVQSGMSTDLARPLMFMASLAARVMGRPVVFMADMDFREHAQRYYKTGQWSLKSYLINRYAYDPLKWLQLRLAPRLFPVCCFKGIALVRDFGRGRPNVHMFYDTVHSSQEVLTDGQLADRLQWIESATWPFTVTYFGRLVANKGIDRMIAATGICRERGIDVRLRIIGDGDCRPALVDQIRRLELQAHVDLLPPVPYGAPLFKLLEDCHLCVAAPLTEDTPRAAFDAFSRGLPIAAFDIAYFRGLEETSGAVVTTPWPQAEGLADSITKFARDRQQLAEFTRRAVRFAAENTQDIWLERRLAWLQSVASPIVQ